MPTVLITFRDGSQTEFTVEDPFAAHDAMMDLATHVRMMDDDSNVFDEYDV